MKVGIELRTGARYEFDMQPGGPFDWLVTLRDRHTYEINEATLDWLIRRQHERQTAEPEPRDACLQEFPWRCPTYPYQPCALRGAYKAEQRRDCAVIQVSPFEPVLEPVGQMSLDKPHVTHRRRWRHLYIPNRVVDRSERPFVAYERVCKRMAVPALLAIQAGVRHWERPHDDKRVKWRIVPLTTRKADRAWLVEQQTKHAGRVPACVFERIG